MPDPNAIARQARRHNLNERLRWRARVFVGRTDRGKSVYHAEERTIWAQLITATGAVGPIHNVLTEQTERHYLIRWTRTVLTIPPETVALVETVESGIAADGTATVAPSPDDAYYDADDGLVRITSIEVLERRRWLLLKLEAAA